MLTRLNLLLALVTLCAACDSKGESKPVEKTVATTTPEQAAAEPKSDARKPGQGLKEAVQIICDSPEKSGSGDMDPSARSRAIARYIEGKLANAYAIRIFASLADAAPEMKHVILRELAVEAEVSPCAILKVFEPVVVEVEKATPGEAAGEEQHLDIPFESHYVGKHKFGVNRVNDGRRNGKATIVREANALVLQAKLTKGVYEAKLFGIVKPISKTEFVLDGELSGVPNQDYRGIAPTKKLTKGKFTFRATKGRKFWRLYEVDGKECVCNDDCGNDFCYVDLSF